MRSRTSFFNQGVFWNDCARCWPLTAAYALLWFLILPLSRLTEYSYERTQPSRLVILRDSLNITAQFGLWVAFFMSILFAMAMFSYLSNPRATNGLHALPARRETLYVTHSLAGLCCQLTVQLFAVALTAVVLGSHGAFDLRVSVLMFLSLALPTLFFYPFAILCMIFSGQLLAAPVFYGILNILVVGVEFLLRTFAGNFLYGWAESDSPALVVFSPLVKLEQYGVYAVKQEGGQPHELVLHGIGWLLVYALTGVALAALALLIYRSRHSEETGCIVAIRWARPIFKYGVAFCAALAMGQLLYYLFFGQYRVSGDYSLFGTLLCMGASGLIGYFASEMLLKKSFRVFLSGWRGAVATVAALLILGVAMSFDLTGYEGYVPAVDQIDSASLSFNPYNGSRNVYIKRLSDAEQLRLLTDAHRALTSDDSRQKSALLEDYYSYDGDHSDPNKVLVEFDVRYILNSGRIVSRAYTALLDRAALGDSSSAESTLTALYNEPGVALARTLPHYGDISEYDAKSLPDLRFTGGYAEFDHLAEDGSYDHSEQIDLAPEQARLIYEAVLRDAEQGNTASSFFDSAPVYPGSITLYASCVDLRSVQGLGLTAEQEEDGRISVQFEPVITQEMSNTLAVLREIGFSVDFESFV